MGGTGINLQSQRFTHREGEAYEGGREESRTGRREPSSSGLQVPKEERAQGTEELTESRDVSLVFEDQLVIHCDLWHGQELELTQELEWERGA